MPTQPCANPAVSQSVSPPRFPQPYCPPGVCIRCDDTRVAAGVQQCPGCGTPVSRGAPCQACAVCAGCATTVAYDDTVDTALGTVICPDCRRHRYWQCEHCDDWTRNGEPCAAGCDDDASCEYDCYCDDCADNGGGLIHDYSYKPRPVFHGAGPVYLGAELEIETPYGATTRCAELADDYLGSLGYLKQDSSIDNGFEIVTHPMSYAWAIEHFPWVLLPDLADAGCEATDNTGLHVHVSRTGFTSPCHIYRWLKFIYRNQRPVITLARRVSAEWAAFTDHDRKAVKDYAKGACSDRYRAINTGNPDTFELRVFASSLEPAEVQAALGFVASSVEYTRSLTVNAITRTGGWTWPAYVDWLRDRPTYQPLTEQLEALACVC